ncbi:MAG: bis(5'-nucleosyl)-tetraphosphatase [Patescibacteria group bacterium]|nr:MAG: bis(5'-nucleosyl)-tetraphosphatase [Patescibacteria group bacterium]
MERSAGAVVFRFAGRGASHRPLYLILHYGSGHWDFPKGGIGKGETTEKTVRREIAEETGITKFKFVSGFKETVHYIYQKEGAMVNKWVVYFLAETQEEKVKLSFEHQGFEWLFFNEAVRRVTFSNSREVLRKAHEYLKLRGNAQGGK